MEPTSRQSQLDAKTARASRYLILPHSTFRTCWDILLVFLVLYNAFSLPFVVCFRVNQPNGFNILDQCIDSIFYMDLILNFFTTYEVKGHLILNHRLVAWNYFTHWFLLDFLGTFPFEVTAGGEIGDARTLEVTLLRGLKCIRLIRLARLFKFLEKIEFVSHFLKLLRLFFGFSVIAHWLACIWYLIGTSGLEWNSLEPQGWMVSYNNTGWNVYEKSHTSAYITSLYWTVTTLLTVGYGDISAHTTVEKIFAIITMVFGALISATIFGNVTMLIESMGRSEAAYREKMEAVKYYMLDLDLPSEMQKRIRDFYTLLWNRNKAFGSEKVLAELPPSFHHEIAGFLNQDLFDKGLIFMDADPVFLRNLAGRLKFCVSLPTDDIIKENEPVDDKIYFIRKGACQVSTELKGKLTVIKEGSFFGEIGLMAGEFLGEFGLANTTGTDSTKEDLAVGLTDPTTTSPTSSSSPSAPFLKPKRTASVTALVNCDLYYLLDTDFHSLIQHYPQYHRLFLLIALARFKQIDYHDDEDIIQKIYLLQVKKKELRLKYHRKKEKVRPRMTSIIGEKGKKGRNALKQQQQQQAAQQQQDSATTETGDTFSETTKDLIRRVSLIGLTEEQREILQAKHERANSLAGLPKSPSSAVGSQGEPSSPLSTASGMDLPSPSGLPASPTSQSSFSPSTFTSSDDPQRPPRLDLPPAHQQNGSITPGVSPSSSSVQSTKTLPSSRPARTGRGASVGVFDSSLPSLLEEAEEEGSRSASGSIVGGGASPTSSRLDVIRAERQPALTSGTPVREARKVPIPSSASSSTSPAHYIYASPASPDSPRWSPLSDAHARPVSPSYPFSVGAGAASPSSPQQKAVYAATDREFDSVLARAEALALAPPLKLYVNTLKNQSAAAREAATAVENQPKRTPLRAAPTIHAHPGSSSSGSSAVPSSLPTVGSRASGSSSPSASGGASHSTDESRSEGHTSSESSASASLAAKEGERGSHSSNRESEGKVAELDQEGDHQDQDHQAEEISPPTAPYSPTKLQSSISREVAVRPFDARSGVGTSSSSSSAVHSPIASPPTTIQGSPVWTAFLNRPFPSPSSVPRGTIAPSADSSQTTHVPSSSTGVQPIANATPTLTHFVITPRKAASFAAKEK